MNNKLKASAMDSVVELSPKVKRSRSTFNLPIKHYTSFNVGELVPIDFTEVLPGDTFNINLNAFVRMTSPSKRAPMDSLHMDIFCFFIPYRFLDKAWVNIQGESSDPWYTAPGDTSLLALPYGITVGAGSLLNHLGLPIGLIRGNYGSTLDLNIYPVYSYFKVINDWFRDENLQAELPFDTTNGTYNATSDITQINSKYIYEKGSLYKVAKYHDLFTSALPAPQKGPSVQLIKNGGKAPVQADFVTGSTISAGTGLYVKNVNGLTSTGNKSGLYGYDGNTGNVTSNLYADVTQGYVTTINELRLAFQLQKAYELDARSGTRYTEAIEARFGTKNPDLRLGRSELLGHYRFDLNMAEVNSTTNQGTTGGSTVSALQGDSYNNGVGAGSSKTGNSQHICVKSFTEHGICMILGCVRPDLTYQQGLDKFWLKKGRFDFYEPIFSNIGEVPIMKSELYGLEAYDHQDSVFGYQEAWYDYRYKVSKISGILASDSNEGFDIFHYGQDFAAAPVLGSTFIQQDSAAVDRTLAFTSSAVDQFICQFQGVIKATRVMPLFSVPGLIDHF